MSDETEPTKPKPPEILVSDEEWELVVRLEAEPPPPTPELVAAMRSARRKYRILGTAVTTNILDWWCRWLGR